jgi:hypothetical protein
MIEITHQRGTRLSSRDLPRGTAHIDVNDRSAKASRLRHPVRLTPSQLNDMESQPLPYRPQQRIWLAREQGRTGYHFGDHKAGPQPGDKPPEWRVRDA